MSQQIHLKLKAEKGVRISQSDLPVRGDRYIYHVSTECYVRKLLLQ